MCVCKRTTRAQVYFITKCKYTNWPFLILILKHNVYSCIFSNALRFFRWMQVSSCMNVWAVNKFDALMIMLQNNKLIATTQTVWMVIYKRDAGHRKFLRYGCMTRTHSNFEFSMCKPLDAADYIRLDTGMFGWVNQYYFTPVTFCVRKIGSNEIEGTNECAP